MQANSTDEQVILNLQKRSKNFFYYGIFSLLIAVVSAIFLPLIVTKCHWISLDVDDPNEIGDTIGGILGPAVAVIAALLTFIAFWAQYEANIEQRKQFLLNQKSQQDDAKTQETRFLDAQKRISKEQFENKYYKLLEIHRQNTREIKIGKFIGPEAFYPLVQELKCAYKMLSDKYLHSDSNPNCYKEEELYQLAYLIFFFGVNNSSIPLFKDLMNDRIFSLYEDVKKPFLLDEKLDYNCLPDERRSFWRKFEYGSFKGHSSSLSHYVRHLFQIVKFVDDQPSELLSDEEKYNYITNLRAQLTSNEQLFIYYNALSVLGYPWMGKSTSNYVNYLKKYCIVKSLPLPLCDFYKHPLKNHILPEYNNQGKPMFEWIEIKERLATVQ